MSKVSDGTEYEKFVQAIYQTLHDEDGFQNIKVEHNKTDLVGKSGCSHQIDVYWEFEVAGNIYRTAIECKAYASNVSIGKIRDFYGVLTDIPNLNGIFVTLEGFQAGAKKYAEHYGIELKELRAPKESDMEGRIQNVHIRYHIIMAKIVKMTPKINDAFLVTLDKDEKLLSTFSGTTHDPYIINSAGQKLASYEDMRCDLPTTNETTHGLSTTLTYSDAHIRADDNRLIPIDHIDVEYDVYVDIKNSEVFGRELARAIIKDVKSGDMKFVH
jgi:hypothetical protein